MLVDFGPAIEWQSPFHNPTKLIYNLIKTIFYKQSWLVLCKQLFMAYGSRFDPVTSETPHPELINLSNISGVSQWRWE